MRRVSLTTRLSQDAPADPDLEVALMLITHPDLAEPLRLSSDPTERFSVEPMIYYTRSIWQTSNNAPFFFLVMGAQLPGDEEDAPHAATIVLDAFSREIPQALRSTTERANVDFAVVKAASPDVVEGEWRGLKLVRAEGSDLEVTLTISRDPVTAEPWPSGRMTRQRFPGLHR